MYYMTETALHEERLWLEQIETYGYSAYDYVSVCVCVCLSGDYSHLSSGGESMACWRHRRTVCVCVSVVRKSVPTTHTLLVESARDHFSTELKELLGC